MKLYRSLFCLHFAAFQQPKNQFLHAEKQQHHTSLNEQFDDSLQYPLGIFASFIAIKIAINVPAGATRRTKQKTRGKQQQWGWAAEEQEHDE